MRLRVTSTESTDEEMPVVLRFMSGCVSASYGIVQSTSVLLAQRIPENAPLQHLILGRVVGKGISRPSSFSNFGTKLLDLMVPNYSIAYALLSHANIKHDHLKDSGSYWPGSLAVS